MGISASVTNNQITATVGETQIDVAVSGGVGPTGSSGTIAVSAPLTNAGTTTAANLGLSVGTGLAVSGGSLVVSYGTSSTVACRGDDARLSDSREWSADTVSQAEAEAGSSTTRRAFTPQRVFQAIAAWWAASASKTKLDGIAAGATANATDAQLRDRSTHTGTQTASTISDFTTAVVAAAPPTTNASLLTSGTLADARLSANVVLTNDARLSDARTPTSHAHGNITNAGAIGSTSGQIVVTTTSGVLTTAASLGWSLISSTPTTLSGYGITDAVASGDSRLTNARTPTAHKSSHATGGTDALSPADIGAAALSHTHSALTDITGLAAIATSGSASDLGAGTVPFARLPVGQTSTTVAAGNDARFTDARTPTGAAGGDLTGTYPNPQIAAGAVVTADLADGAVTTAKLANSAVTVAKVSATGTPSASTFLRGDGAWATAGSTNAGDLTAGNLAFARHAARVRASASLYLWSSFR